MTILQVRDLSKHFGGVYAVDGVSLTFEKGTITSIIGPNGSGKSTLVNLLSGMFPFNAGTITITNKNLQVIKPYDIPNYGITRTFQEVRLFNQMTVLDNILAVLGKKSTLGSLFEKTSPDHLQKAQQLLKEVNLWEKRNNLAQDLSYGQRKLLEIARTQCMNAQIFLFDEPFAGLFQEMVDEFVSIIQNLKKEGKTIILIEHNMVLIRQLSDKVIVLDSGKLLAQGTPEKVLKEKKVIEAYLGE